jgi:hypothetical protein
MRRVRVESIFIRRLTASIIATLTLLVIACGSPGYEEHPGTPGWPCQSTGECHTGLTCEPLGSGKCPDTVYKCTTRCTAQSDCAALGDRYRCQSVCGNYFACIFI